MIWRNGNHPDSSSQEERTTRHFSEYYALIMGAVLGGHLLVMSVNFIMVFVSLELISISSYVLTSFAFNKRSTEGSLKYFLFGSVASAVMLYGLSLLYGMTGTLDFSSTTFIDRLISGGSPLFFLAGTMVLAGFFYKITAAPLHPWAPDVYESAPMPVVAFFSVVPKLAGIAILARFVLAINLFGQSPYDWQTLLSIAAILTLTVGNFSALWQKNPKRLMAYSSIAQSGFFLVGVAAFLPQGIQFMLFYASVYVLMNFLIFLYLQYFDLQGFETIADYAGSGKQFLWPAVFMLTGFVALTGLPPTAGFTGKLFIFSSLWEAYQLSGKQVLLWLMIFGLLNAVVSLFYYLRIPYYALIKSGESQLKANNLTFENLLGLVLVLVILILFFSPGLLMGWINKINFAL
jgi:NADH-quinone oxidoreductase subunit N